MPRARTRARDAAAAPRRRGAGDPRRSPGTIPAIRRALLAIPDPPPAAVVSRRARRARRARPWPSSDRARRRASALEMAARLAADLAARGVVVVSGLARGVDSARIAARCGGGRTIAVLGSGARSRLSAGAHGAGARRSRGRASSSASIRRARRRCRIHFPQRNRIISGLSRAVVVDRGVASRVGSLITAALRARAGPRRAWRCPGNVLSGRNRGGHALHPGRRNDRGVRGRYPGGARRCAAAAVGVAARK